MNDSSQEEPQQQGQGLQLSRPTTGKRAAGKYTTQPWEADGSGGALVGLSVVGKAIWTAIIGLLVTAINAVATALAPLVTIATEQTAQRKQGQSRPIYGATLPTGLILTFAAAYNNVFLVVSNENLTDEIFKVTHTFSGGSAVYYGTVAASSTTMLTIPGVALGDTLVGVASTNPVTLGVYASTE